MKSILFYYQKSKLFPYYSKRYNSIIAYNDCCFVTKGYEKYIGNLYKFKILYVHMFSKSNLVDKSLCHLNKNLTNIYNKFEYMFDNIPNIYYYGKN